MTRRAIKVLLALAVLLTALSALHGAYHVDNFGDGSWRIPVLLDALTPCVADPACHAVLNGFGFAAMVILWAAVWLLIRAR